jgi:hypothetical protein
VTFFKGVSVRNTSSKPGPQQWVNETVVWNNRNKLYEVIIPEEPTRPFIVYEFTWRNLRMNAGLAGHINSDYSEHKQLERLFQKNPPYIYHYFTRFMGSKVLPKVNRSSDELVISCNYEKTDFHIILYDKNGNENELVGIYQIILNGLVANGSMEIVLSSKDKDFGFYVFTKSPIKDIQLLLQKQWSTMIEGSSQTIFFNGARINNKETGDYLIVKNTNKPELVKDGKPIPINSYELINSGIRIDGKDFTFKEKGGEKLFRDKVSNRRRFKQ